MTDTTTQEVNPAAERLNVLLQAYADTHTSEAYRKALANPLSLLELDEEAREAVVAESDPTNLIKGALAEADITDAERLELALEALKQMTDGSAEMVNTITENVHKAMSVEESKMASTMAAILAKTGPVSITLEDAKAGYEARERVETTVEGDTLTYSLRPVVPGSEKVQ